MVNELLKSRRSIRKYKEQLIPEEKVNQLKEVCLLSPTSKNKKPCEFIFVENKEKLKVLSESKPKGGQMISSSALSIVVIADPDKSDVWIEDASIVSAYIHLACHDLGLGSCWVQIRNRMKNYEENISSESIIKKALQIPMKYNVLSVIAIGYPDESKKENIIESLSSKSIHREVYNK
jgi:nitroreductase